MRGGRLDKVVTLQAPTAAKGSSGGNVTTWSDVATIWAGISNPSGNERRSTKHGGEGAEARTEFTIRYREGVTALMRVSYKGAYYNIKHVNNVNEASEKLILTCDTGMNNG